MVEENERDQEFEKKVDLLLAEAANVEYPPQLHQRAIFVWREEMVNEKPFNRFGWLGYAASFACVAFIAVFVFSDSVPDTTEMQISSNKSKIGFVEGTSIRMASDGSKQVEDSIPAPERTGENAVYIATNMVQDELEDVSDEEVGEFYAKLKKYRETNAVHKPSSMIYMPAAAAANYSSNR